MIVFANYELTLVEDLMERLSVGVRLATLYPAKINIVYTNHADHQRATAHYPMTKLML